MLEKVYLNIIILNNVDFKDATPHFCQIENEVVFDRAPLDLHKTVLAYRLSPPVICGKTCQIITVQPGK